jgi:hypothetical protein
VSTEPIVNPRDVRKQLHVEQLKRGGCGIGYRAEQLAYLADLNKAIVGSKHLAALLNARLEAALVNSRVLAYFLGEYQDGVDLHIWHYSMSAWRKPEGFDALCDEIDQRTSWHLAHANIGRKQVERHPGAWPIVELAETLVGATADFVHALAGTSPAAAALFTPSPSLSHHALRSRVPALVPTEISRHEEVGALTRHLQTHLGLTGKLTETEDVDDCGKPYEEPVTAKGG